MIDPVAYVTAAGIAFAALLGGQPSGYGAQVGIVITADDVRLGITPITIWSVPREKMPPSITGMTLGGTILLREMPAREVVTYEHGHLPLWASWGIEYPAAILRYPCAYDPAAFRPGDPAAMGYVCDGYRRIEMGPPVDPAPVHYSVSVPLRWSGGQR